MNKRIKIALVLLAVILIAALSISLAYSKYFTEVTGTGEAIVAKWNFKVNGQDQTITKITLANTLAENDKVVAGKVAPGTAGQFAVNLNAEGTEVALDYKIEFKNFSSNFPANLKFYTTKNGDTYSNPIPASGLEGTIGLDDSKTKDLTIYWVWAYETGTSASDISTNDSKDTTSGKTAGTATFDVVITGTQQANV